MASLSKKFANGFGKKHFTSDEKIKTGIRAVVGLIPVIVFLAFSARDFNMVVLPD